MLKIAKSSRNAKKKFLKKLVQLLKIGLLVQLLNRSTVEVQAQY